MSADDISTASSRLYAQAGGKPPSMSVSDTARMRQQGSMGAEKIGKTSGPGVLGALKDSYLGQRSQELPQGLSRVLEGVKQFVKAPGPEVMEALSHPGTDTAATEIPAGALQAVGSAFAPLGSAAAEGTRGVAELTGASPDTARQLGGKAGLTSEMIAGGLPLIEAPASAASRYADAEAATKEAAQKAETPNLGQRISTELMQGAVNQPATTNPKVAARRTQTLLEEGLAPDRAGTAKRDAIRQQVGSQLGEAYKNAPQEPTVPLEPIEQSLDELAAKFQKQGRTDAVAKVQKVKSDFLDQYRDDQGNLRPLTPAEAHDVKVGYQEEVQTAKANAYDRFKGGGNAAPLPPDVQALKVIPKAIGDQLVSQFPETKALNARYSAIMDVSPSLNRAAQNTANARGRFGLLELIGASVGGATGVLHGNFPGGSLAGVAAVKILRDPAFRARAAVKLYKMSGGKPAGASVADLSAQLAQQASDYVGAYPDNVTPIGDVKAKILNDMAVSARSREDQQTADRLSALANR